MRLDHLLSKEGLSDENVGSSLLYLAREGGAPADLDSLQVGSLFVRAGCAEAYCQAESTQDHLGDCQAKLKVIN